MSWGLGAPVIFQCGSGQEKFTLRARDAHLDDLEAILEIEAAGHPTPWPRAIFEGELELERSHTWVFEEPAGEGEAGVIVAFLVFWLIHDEIHILNIAVARAARRRGIGSTIIEYILARARSRDISFVTLEVRRNNRAAIGLYESMGFMMIGERAEYYEDTGEDALILSHLLDP